MESTTTETKAAGSREMRNSTRLQQINIKSLLFFFFTTQYPMTG
jgi:hypothetical protein